MLPATCDICGKEIVGTLFVGTDSLGNRTHHCYACSPAEEQRQSDAARKRINPVISAEEAQRRYWAKMHRIVTDTVAGMRRDTLRALTGEPT